MRCHDAFGDLSVLALSQVRRKHFMREGYPESGTPALVADLAHPGSLVASG